MAETYAVEASLEWKTNVPAVLREVMAAFEQVNRTVAQFKDNLAELSGSGKGVSALIRQLNRLKVPPEALDGLREMGNVTRTLEEAQAGLAKEARETAQAWRQMAEASKQVRLPSGGGAGGRQGGKGGGGHGWSHGDLVDGAMGAQMAGDAGMGLAGQAFHAYADVQLQTTLAQADKRVTDAVMARANGVITTLQKQYPALTQAEGLTLFRNTMGIFGDADESLAALPGAVRLQQLYELAPLGKGGTGGSEVQAAEKAGDAMQSFIDPKTGKLDKGLYDKWMDLQARSYTAGGGLVDAKNWLAFARTSRSAGIGLSDRALEETQALLEMSPGRTGTALMSAFQVFGASTKHMTKANRGAWNKAGLLDKSGDIVDQQLYQKDPYAWVWDEMVPKLAARGIKTREQVLKWLTENGQRGTVSGLLADIAVGKTPITNTATKMENQDPKLVDKLVNTDVGKLAAFHAAETNFLVALGKFGEGPGLTLLTDLTKILNKLVEEAEAHPEAAKRLIGVGLGLSLLSKVVGDSAMAALFIGGPLVKGVGGLAKVLTKFAAGGEAEVALATLAGTGVGSLLALSGAIVALGAAAGYASLHMSPVIPSATPDKPSGTFGQALRTGMFGASIGVAGSFLDMLGLDFSSPKTPAPAPVPPSQAQHAVATPLQPHATVAEQMAQYDKDRHLTVNTTNYIMVDGKVVAKAVTQQQVAALKSAAGPTGGDARAVPTPAGATAQ